MLKEAFLKGFKRDYARTIAKALPSSTRKALVKENAKEGLGLAGMAAGYIANKAGKKRAYHKVLKAVHEKPLLLDTYVGSKLHNIMQKMPIGKNLFKTKEHIRINAKASKVTGKKVVHEKGLLGSSKKVEKKRSAVENEKYMVHERPSAIAPLTKATEIAKPIVFGLAVDKGLRDHSKRKNGQEH